MVDEIITFYLKDLNMNIFSILSFPYSRLTNHRKRFKEVLFVVSEYKVLTGRSLGTGLLHIECDALRFRQQQQ